MFLLIIRATATMYTGRFQDERSIQSLIRSLNDKNPLVRAGVTYPSGFEAKGYVDAEASYTSNETPINWDAPAVFVMGFLTECSSVSRGR